MLLNSLLAYQTLWFLSASPSLFGSSLHPWLFSLWWPINCCTKQIPASLDLAVAEDDWLQSQHLTKHPLRSKRTNLPRGKRSHKARTRFSAFGSKLSKLLLCLMLQKQCTSADQFWKSCRFITPLPVVCFADGFLVGKRPNQKHPKTICSWRVVVENFWPIPVLLQLFTFLPTGLPCQGRPAYQIRLMTTQSSFENPLLLFHN